MNTLTLPKLLALCVSTLLREGRAAEVDEAIRQGREVARRAGPYPQDDGGPDDDGAVIRHAVLADAAMFEPHGANPLADAHPIKLGGSK